MPARSLVTIVAILSTLAPAGITAQSQRPNILLIYLDNIGYGDLGCYGNREVKTPHIDQLAGEGVRCTSFYVVTPSCTPSRGALLTGRYPLRNGLSHQLVTTENWHGIGLPQRERILPQYLKEADYVTGCFGKWNIGFAPGSRPTERGFDEFLGFRSGNIHYFAHTYHGELDMFRSTQRHRIEGYSTDLFADAACDFIRRQKVKPWFVYLPFNAAHYVSSINTAPGEKPQWQVPGKFLERYGWPPNDSHERHRYLALLTALDDGIGRVLDTVDSLQLRSHTLVILLSDMGAILQPGKGKGAASNGPFRDGAPSVYEGGVRVPCMVRWPGELKPGHVCDAVLSHLDLLPLCLRAAGMPLPKDRVIDGHDPFPALAGESGSPHEQLFFRYGKAEAVRAGTLKLIRRDSKSAWEVYNLAADIGEQRNVASERPDDVARLRSLIEFWHEDAARDASPPAVYRSQEYQRQ